MLDGCLGKAIGSGRRGRKRGLGPRNRIIGTAGHSHIATRRLSSLALKVHAITTKTRNSVHDDTEYWKGRDLCCQLRARVLKLFCVLAVKRQARAFAREAINNSVNNNSVNFGDL